jgi:hypothetical protein
MCTWLQKLTENWKTCTLDMIIIANILFACLCICFLHFRRSLRISSSVCVLHLFPEICIIFDMLIWLPKNCLLVEVLHEMLGDLSFTLSFVDNYTRATRIQFGFRQALIGQGSVCARLVMACRSDLHAACALAVSHLWSSWSDLTCFVLTADMFVELMLAVTYYNCCLCSLIPH